MKKILCVDDEPINLMIIEVNLMAQGYEVYKAEDGLTAIRMVRDIKPQLVLLDIMMPGLNGIDTLKEIKKIDPDLPVIMVTGVTDEETAKSAVEQGAYDYVTKPIDFEYLNTTILIKLL
ncbi:MAG TPA: response regulator [Syntrophales bacterium]|jgi:two-component system nitrogen regulation response regulator NtrX|nr:response regulator [Syntrophales bacterium]HON23736.1 response regulator [Syntrophales bacterium]HOU78466.1 response regulator [Syntrophales bacterium]HPC32807.1 response regulator [Syntrophales bacterium]HQG34818.1 response regulator [Syntrophales bacterium]